MIKEHRTEYLRQKERKKQNGCNYCQSGEKTISKWYAGIGGAVTDCQSRRDICAVGTEWGGEIHIGANIDRRITAYFGQHFGIRKRYSERKDRNSIKLHKYAKLFNIEDEVRKYLEVLL